METNSKEELEKSVLASLSMVQFPLDHLSKPVTPTLALVFFYFAAFMNYYYYYYYKYVILDIRGTYYEFPDFFRMAFKIVVDTWKFTMLLLYILWDDWPIFMISASNEQQELEYTLKKPDCHSWWISKMLSGREEERYAIKFCFKLGKNATETYGRLQTALGASCMNRASVFAWHKWIKEGRESVRDDEMCGSKEVRTPELIGQRVRVRVIMLRF